MLAPKKWVSGLLIALAVGIGAGSIVLFAGWPVGALRIVRPHWSEALVLFWDAALSMLFFVQHSGMVRRNVRARFCRLFASVYWPAAYAIASGAALLIVVLLWQPSGIGFYSLTGLLRRIAQGFGVAAAGLFVWGLWSLKSFDPLGVSGLAGYLRSRPAPPCAFAVRGPYRFVRHPLYLAIIVALWSCPDVAADRLVFNVLWTAWIVVGTLLEEADLVAEIGDAYRAYRRTVPMLMPRSNAGPHVPAQGEAS
jgi:protein-S-isoprenylcysteine O-methyltransferase Ste14